MQEYDGWTVTDIIKDYTDLKKITEEQELIDLIGVLENDKEDNYQDVYNEFIGDLIQLENEFFKSNEKLTDEKEIIRLNRLIIDNLNELANIVEE